jgi:catechol 2,3-dioxygenase-like lactoylglutathione lyase family enzyme
MTMPEMTNARPTPVPTTDVPAGSAGSPQPRLQVFPQRFTPHPQETIPFLTTHGMVPSVTAGDDSFGDLRAGAGAVMVHSAAGSASGATGGITDLCLLTGEADAAATALEERGFDVTVWDESYGKQGMIAGPGEGEAISLNEDQRDFYGYAGHDASGADVRLRVCAVVSSPDFEADAAYFARLGYQRVGPSSEWWQELHGPASSGIIGLHKPGAADARTRDGSDDMEGVGHALQVRLGFETTEDLGELASRLQEAGYHARVVEDAVRSVHVTDPDGLTLEIHPLPEGATAIG